MKVRGALGSAGATKVPDSPTALAYAAGLIDGEGCIYGLCKMRGSKLNTIVRVSVLMCSKSTVEWLRDNFGGSFYTLPTRANRPDRFLWQVACSHVVPVLRAILPYLIEKRAQAEVALRLADLLSVWGNPGGNYRSDEQRISQENRSERIALCTELKRLKRPWQQEVA